jgi:oligo-1,6-glucosidase/alpha-glucosidase
MLFQSKVMTENHPDTFEFVRKLRKTVDEYTDPPRYLVGEVFGSMEQLKRFCGEDSVNSGLHTVFLFRTMNTPLRASRLRKLMRDFERWFPEPFIPTWVYGNHDGVRRMTVLKGSVKKARLNALLQFTVRGIPFTYYGEEIGMVQGDIPVKDAQDPVARPFEKLPRIVQNLLQRITRGSIARDGCRTPMQWNENPNAGFCEEKATPWLPLNENFGNCNVHSQEADADSLLSFYKQLLRLRAAHPQLHGGPAELLPSSSLPRNVLGYRRENLCIYLNFGKRKQNITIAEQPEALILSTHAGAEFDIRFRTFSGGNTLLLLPGEGVILKMKG